MKKLRTRYDTFKNCTNIFTPSTPGINSHSRPSAQVEKTAGQLHLKHIDILTNLKEIRGLQAFRKIVNYTCAMRLEWGVCGRWVNSSNSGSEGPRFKPRLSRCFPRQGTLLHFVSLHPDVWTGASNILLGGNLAMDQHPVQGGEAILLGLHHASETGINSDGMGLWLVYAFTYNGSTGHFSLCLMIFLNFVHYNPKRK